MPEEITFQYIEDAIRDKRKVVLGHPSIFDGNFFVLSIRHQIIETNGWPFILSIKNARRSEVFQSRNFGGCLAANIKEEGDGSTFFKVYSQIKAEPTLEFIRKCLNDKKRLVLSDGLPSCHAGSEKRVESIVEPVNGGFNIANWSTSRPFSKTMVDAATVTPLKDDALAVNIPEVGKFKFKFYEREA